MPKHYKNAVLTAYKEKKKAGTLSPNLLMPTPGDIREECLRIYHERSSIEDDKIIKLFFSNNDNEKGCINILENSYASKFKQVPKILKEKGPEPGIRFIELLAWLIDFQPRPSTLYYKTFEQLTKKNGEGEIKNPDSVNINPPNNSKTEDGKDKSGDDQPTEEIDPPENDSVVIVNTEDKPKPRFSFLNIFAIAILFLLLESGAGYIWRNYTDQISVPGTDEKCMYWAGTHYEPIKCGAVKGNIPVVDLDVKKLNTLKKIYLSDTLTEKSIGRVWYSGFGKQKHEYFTDSGMHPVDTVKRLKKLTSGILLKHVSYHRFLLNAVALISCSVVLAVVLAFGCIYLRRKQKKKLAVKTD